MAQALDPFAHNKASYPLAGSELPYDVWLARHCPHAISSPLAAHHRRAWEWFEGLEQGKEPPALIECWPRGHGKSTTVELAVVRQCVKATRRFILYVCRTQDAANFHVQAIAAVMERVGIDRAVNKYGLAKGWSSNLLRTANGCNVLAFGLDAGARGVKLDEVRPDLIVLDDVDDLDDNVEGIAKKYRTITQTVLPTGARDAAVVFVQNLIHPRSIMAQALSGEADMLRRRLQSPPVMAVKGLAYEGDGDGGYRVTAGVSTWEGKPLEACEAEINKFGLVSFLRECQHEGNVGGRFFSEFEGIDHGGPGVDGRHVCLPFDVPAHWTRFGGLDWGYRAPFAFILNAVDESGDVCAIDEVYTPGLTNPQQAEAVKRCLESNGCKLSDVLITADPSMWAKKVHSDGIARADIEDFWSVGLRCVQANNNRAHGFSNFRNYLASPGGFRAFKGKCPNLIRTMALAVFSKTSVEDLDDDADSPPGHMDIVNAERYGLGQRIRASRAAAKPVDNRPQFIKDAEKPKRRIV